MILPRTMLIYTKYGEFVSSYFAWLTLDKQKKKTDEMENMTDK